MSASSPALPQRNVSMTNSSLLVFSLPQNDMQRHMGMSCLSPWHKSPELGKKTIQPPDTSFEDVRTSFGWSLLQIWWQIQNLWWNMCKLCKTGKLWTDKNQGCVYFGCNLPLPQSAPSYSVLPKLSEGSKALNVKTVESYGIWDKDNNMMSHACLATTRVLSDSTTEITYIHGFKVISNCFVSYLASSEMYCVYVMLKHLDCHLWNSWMSSLKAVGQNWTKRSSKKS